MAAKIGRPPVPTLIRYLDKITIGHESGCALWTGGKNPAGYGVISHNGKTTLVHRWAYEEFRGLIPPGLTIDHDPCDTPGCVNPYHLKPKTQKDNNARGKSPTMQANRAGTCLSGRHDMTDVYVKKNGDRQCRPCQREKG